MGHSFVPKIKFVVSSQDVILDWKISVRIWWKGGKICQFELIREIVGYVWNLPTKANGIIKSLNEEVSRKSFQRRCLSTKSSTIPHAKESLSCWQWFPSFFMWELPVFHKWAVMAKQLQIILFLIDNLDEQYNFAANRPASIIQNSTDLFGPGPINHLIIFYWINSLRHHRRASVNS